MRETFTAELSSSRALSLSRVCSLSLGGERGRVGERGGEERGERRGEEREDAKQIETFYHTLKRVGREVRGGNEMRSRGRGQGRGRNEEIETSIL